MRRFGWPPLALLLVGCSLFDSRHAAVGHWKSDFAVLVVYRDGTASFNGLKFRWQSVDAATVKLEIQDEGQDWLIEFSVERDEKGDIGILHLAVPVAFRRSREGH